MSKDLKLYAHNENAYEKINAAFMEGKDIVGLVHATGTGKSYIALKYAYLHPQEKIVYVVPSKGIIEHLKNVIAQTKGFEYFKHIEFRTYQSFINLATEDIENILCDVLILDEFHHLGAPVWGERIKYFIASHPNIKVLGLTAYTIRNRGTIYERDMTNPDGEELFSGKIISRYDLVDAMIDKIIPKPIYKTAYINLFDIYNDLNQKLDRFKGHKDYELLSKILSDVKKRIHEAPSIAELLQKNIKPNGKYIYYCPPFSETDVNDIETIKKEAYGWFKNFVAEENICFYTTTSQMGEKGKKNREAFYHDQDLEGNDASNKLRIMFAINQYNEGIHAPNIDGVILGRGTSSDIVYFEQIGQALTVRGNSKEKFLEYEKYTYEYLWQLVNKRNIKVTPQMTKEDLIELLVAPIIIDLTNNFDYIKELENNLKERIKERKINQKYSSREIILENASFDIEIENQDLFAMLSYVRDRLGFSWYDYYHLLEEYKNKYGNCEVPKFYVTESGIKLGIWVQNQRRRLREKSLDPEKIALLQKLDINFQDTLPDSNWQKYYEELKNFYEKNGHTMVGSHYVTENGLVLGYWIYSQKRQYQKGELKGNRLKLLQEINFNFDINNIEDWMSYYQKLKEYYEEYGTAEVKKNYVTKDGFNLGAWCNTQRRKYNLGELKEERINLLNELKFRFDGKSNNEKWYERYHELEKYFEEYQNTDVPRNYVTPAGIKLGEWVSRQKDRYNAGELPIEKISLLQKLDFNFTRDFSEKAWEKGYAKLVEYYEEYGNSQVPAKFITKDGYNLGSWVVRQKVNYKSGNLSPVKIKLLQKLDFNFNRDFNAKAWEKGYTKLVEYYEEYGNSEVPAKFITKDGYNLGNWVAKQRRAYRNQKLSQERIDKLKRLNFHFEILKKFSNAISETKATVDSQNKENSIKDSNNWYEYLLKLGSYINEYQRLPQEDDPDLYNWLKYQQELSAKDLLPKERKEYLQSLGVIENNKSQKK